MRPRSLGSKARSFVPKTSRSNDDQPPQKKFKSSAAPKGTKLASGYVDRVQERQTRSVSEGDEKQERLKRLEDMLKLEQIDQGTFEKLKDEIGIGGDISSTHLVKGLDFKLLERVRKGDDVSKAASEHAENESAEAPLDVEEELEKALEKDVTSVRAQKSAEENDKTQPMQQTKATTLSRDEILRRLKQNRKNPEQSAADTGTYEEPVPVLDQSKFRKVQSATKVNKKRFTETVNGRRREVLVITDKEGKTKRKTRWLDPPSDPTTQGGTEATGAWGSDLPAEILAKQKAAAELAAREAEEDVGEDIFGGVAAYDPLAGLESGEDGEESEAEHKHHQERSTEQSTGSNQFASKPRNYFGTDPEQDETTKAPSHDAAILAALKRAAQIRKQEDDDSDEAVCTDEADRLAKPAGNTDRSAGLLKKLQQQSRQDEMDLDMGFGGDTRYDDDDDEGDSRQKLSEWKGFNQEDDEDDEEGRKRGGGKRKRGGKKKKGDKNSYADVMSVLERRKRT